MTEERRTHWNGGIVSLEFSECKYGAWPELALAFVLFVAAVYENTRGLTDGP